MTEQPRDWDKELADIDRVIDKHAAARQALPARLPVLPEHPPVRHAAFGPRKARSP